MKIKLLSLIILVINTNLWAVPNVPKSLIADSVFAGISVAQALDTVAAYSNNPWFVILDVRTPAEYASMHIAKGVNIDFYATDFSTTLATLNKNKVYLLHCASGGRSGQVYTMMQNLGFQRVYNMTGGINAWSAAAYPTTTATAPVLSALCDTTLNLGSIFINHNDSIEITITNSANDTLRNFSINSLTGSPFSTNFDTTKTLLGARDYNFNIYYSPITPANDSLVLTLNSSGGPLNFTIHASAAFNTSISNPASQDYSLFNDVSNKRIVIKTKNQQIKTTYSLFDANGRLISSSNLNSESIVDYSAYKKGLYIVRINSAEASKSYKLIL